MSEAERSWQLLIEALVVGRLRRMASDRQPWLLWVISGHRDLALVALSDQLRSRQVLGAYTKQVDGSQDHKPICRRC